MASIFRLVSRRNLLFSSKTMIQQVPDPHFHVGNHVSQSISQTIRTYVSEMYKSAVDANVLRLLRYEIQYEFDHSPPLQPVTKFRSFEIDERPGEQWITLTRKYEEKEVIKIEVTMFEGSIPAPKSSGVPGEDVPQLHITFIVNIIKGEGGGDVMEVLCSAWPDSIEIHKVFVKGSDQIQAHLYKGPPLKELDDGLQNSLYEFLEARDINDELAVFMYRYMANKDKTEYIRWMENVKSFVEKK